MPYPVNNSFHAQESDESDSESGSTSSKGHIGGVQRSGLMGTSVQTPGQRDILDHTPLFRPCRRMHQEKRPTGSRDAAVGVEGSRRWTLGGDGGNAEAGPSRLGATRPQDPVPHIRTAERPPRRSLPSHHTDQRLIRPEKRRRTIMAMTNTAGLINAEAIVVSDDDDDVIFIPNPPASTTPSQSRAWRDPAIIPDTVTENRTVGVERSFDRQIRSDRPEQSSIAASASTPALHPAVLTIPRIRTPSANSSQASAIIPSASPIANSTAGPSRTPYTCNHQTLPLTSSTLTTSGTRPRVSYRVIPSDEAVIDMTVPRQSHVTLITPSSSPPPPASQDTRGIIVIDDSEDEAEDEDQRAMDRHISRLEERTRLAMQKKAQEEEARLNARHVIDDSSLSGSASVAAGPASTAIAIANEISFRDRRLEQTALDLPDVTVTSSNFVDTTAAITSNETDGSVREIDMLRQPAAQAGHVNGCRPASGQSASVAVGKLLQGIAASVAVLPIRTQALQSSQRKSPPDTAAEVHLAGPMNKDKAESYFGLKHAERPSTTQSEPDRNQVAREKEAGPQTAKEKQLDVTPPVAESTQVTAESNREREGLQGRQEESRRAAEGEKLVEAPLSSSEAASTIIERNNTRQDKLRAKLTAIAQAAAARTREEAAEAEFELERQSEKERLDAAASARKKEEEKDKAAVIKRKVEESRLETERVEEERVEEEERCAVKEREDVERRERERLDIERLERERLEKEQQEKEMVERLRQERLEREALGRVERLRAKKEEEKKQDDERKERERLETERVVLAKQREEWERREAERLDRERAEKLRLDRERLARDPLARQEQTPRDGPVRTDGPDPDQSVVSAGRVSDATTVETTMTTSSPVADTNGLRMETDQTNRQSPAPNADSEQEGNKQQRLAEARRIIRIAEAKRKKIMLENKHKEAMEVAKSNHSQKAVLDLVARAKAQAQIAEDTKKAGRNGKAQAPVSLSGGREVSGPDVNARRARKWSLLHDGDSTGPAGSRVTPRPEKRIRTASDSFATAASGTATASGTKTTDEIGTDTTRVEVEKRSRMIIPSPGHESSPTVQAIRVQSSQSATANIGGPHPTLPVMNHKAMSSSLNSSINTPSTKITLKATSSTCPAPLFTELFPGSDPAQDPVKRLDRMARFLDTLGEVNLKRSEADVATTEPAAPMQAPPTPPEIQDHQPELVNKATEVRPGPTDTDNLRDPRRPIEQSDLLRKYGLPGPISKGRIDNKYTRFSTAIVPGTLKDLMWELDLLYYGSVRGRQDMRWQEEDKIWDNLRNLSDKWRFLQCCWNRWTTEKGPIQADRPAQHLRGWIDKYGEIMRFGGLDLEIRDFLATLLETNIIGLQTFTNACQYWDRHMRHYRKIRERPEPLDEELSDTEQYVERGVIRLKEFEPGGRHYDEVIERKRARAEGRQPVLPKEKYVLE